MLPEQVGVVRVGVGGVLGPRLGPVPREDLHLERLHDRPGDLVLHGEDAGQLAVVRLGPEVVTPLRIDELRIDPDARAVPADAPIEDGGDAQGMADLRERRGPAAEREGRRAAGDAKPVDVDEGVQDLLRHAVGEVPLVLRGAEICERQDRDRRTGHGRAGPAAVPQEPREPGGGDDEPERDERGRDANGEPPASRQRLGAGARRRDRRGAFAVDGGRAGIRRCPGEHGDDGEPHRERDDHERQRPLGEVERVHYRFGHLDQRRGDDAVARDRPEHPPHVMPVQLAEPVHEVMKLHGPPDDLVCARPLGHIGRCPAPPRPRLEAIAAGGSCHSPAQPGRARANGSKSAFDQRAPPQPVSEAPVAAR